MKKPLPRVLLSTSVLLFSLATFLFANFSQTKAAALCTTSPTSGSPGDTITITTTPGGAFGDINIQGAFSGTVIKVGYLATAPGPATFNIPNVTPGLYAVRVGTLGASCDDLSILAAGGGGTTSLGTITPPAGIPNPDNATNYTAGLIRNGISLLIIVAFVVALLWTIFAGFRFVTSGGDSKTVGQAWSSIYWGIIGMIVVVGSYAIVKLVETFFQVNILSGGLILP